MRIKELDAFRGIAAMAVMIYHYTTIYDNCYADSYAFFSLDYGWLGVPFFFILSGFVITLTIERCATPKEFLLKRFLRLYPTYWICLCITLAAVYILKMDKMYDTFDKPLPDIIMNFTMFHRYFNFDNVDGAYWSLLPELLFYLIMAFLLWINYHKKVFLYNTFLLVIAAIHYFFPLPIIGKSLAIYYILLFMIGIHFYHIYLKKSNWVQYLFIILNFFVGVFLYQIPHPKHSLLFLFLSFGVIILLFSVFAFKKLAFFGKVNVLVFLGTISYALYLIHQTIGYGIMFYLDRWMNRELSIIITSGVAIALAWGVTIYIEPIFKKPIAKVILSTIKNA